MIWVERFRPKKFEEIIGQIDIVKEIKIGLHSLPHLLFHGPAGVGKTTMAEVIGRELFGESFRSNFLELNASDERGIQTIREKVKGFAKIKPLGAEFKIIFLDEADYLTNDAQASLRRIMEIYVNTTKFILSCNYLSKIIKPLQSRCKVYNFQPLKEEEVEGLLKRILAERGLQSKIGDDVIRNVVKASKGDVRRCINEIQGLAVLKGATVENVKRAGGNRIEEITATLEYGSFMKTRMVMDGMLKEGWDVRRMLVELRDWFITQSRMTEMDLRGEALLEIMKADERLVWGVEECLVLDGLVVGLLENNSSRV